VTKKEEYIATIWPILYNVLKAKRARKRLSDILQNDATKFKMFKEETLNIYEMCKSQYGEENTKMLWGIYATEHRLNIDPNSSVLLREDWLHIIRRGKHAYNVIPRLDLTFDLSQQNAPSDSVIAARRG
jgi:hypothetical protein